MFQLKQRFFYCTIPLVIILVAVIGVCSDDDPTQPNGAILPTCTSIWPAGVSSCRVFDTTCRQFESMPQFFEHLEDVLPYLWVWGDNLCGAGRDCSNLKELPHFRIEGARKW